MPSRLESGVVTGRIWGKRRQASDPFHGSDSAVCATSRMANQMHKAMFSSSDAIELDRRP